MSTSGEIHFTGFEDSGVCWYCGGELPKRRRRWCCDACRDVYYETWNWHFSSIACVERSDHCCANCHRKENYKWKQEQVSLEVHHIIPMVGQDRSWHELNRPDNLICLCHDCHMEVHRAMRELKEKPTQMDEWDYAKQTGQMVMELKV